VEVRQLEHFLAVVEEGQFTRAAHRCLIAQSGLSASVRALERDLGTALLYRSTRSVRLTDTGRALVPEARRVIAAVGAARDSVQAVASGDVGSLTVGTVASAGLWFDLPELLARFHGRHPNIEIHMTTGDAHQLLDGIESYALDVSLVGLPGDLADDMVAVPMASAPCVLACPSDSPLATRSRLTLTDVADEVFINLGPGAVMRQMADDLLAPLPGERTVRFEVQDVDTALRLVAYGLGSVVLAEPPDPAPAGVAFVPWERSVVWTLALVAPRPDRCSRATLAFLDEAAAS
jgi:DNA-binding transcriptional LysR family regulator